MEKMQQTPTPGTVLVGFKYPVDRASELKIVAWQQRTTVSELLRSAADELLGYAAPAQSAQTEVHG